MPCDVPCHLTKERQFLWNGTADLVLFSFNQGSEVDTLVAQGAKKSHQHFALSSMEPSTLFPDLSRPEYLKKFDLKATYHLDSDVPRIYLGHDRLNPETFLDFHWMTPPRAKRKDRLVSLVVSNCGKKDKNGRLRYMKELGKHVFIHSFGQCLNNAKASDYMDEPMPDSHERMRKRNRSLQDVLRNCREKMELIRTFKFHLALENSDTPDYVTEKFGIALAAGTVPIVKSRKNNYHLFAPHPHSYVVAEDFASPKVQTGLH
ncbi:unnamed protein product [Vitrella brassicaformis CCMP3155]|uniref:Fucosyltransferase n=1 Tax=Vitrella brassicaformis (strain CCMP3155) TaxID=1169540 RepID=A0A0G4EKU8_VITBC|nr:unnamed protein product [Vitrella brassicaformis CCMP3155]|eukprot:CEL97130.1 unnamed protein product [Vitrella brassicaformis CCMP3155]